MMVNDQIYFFEIISNLAPEIIAKKLGNGNFGTTIVPNKNKWKVKGDTAVKFNKDTQN